MAANLNLLPPELTVSKSLGNLLKTLRAINVIAIAAFLIFGAGMAAFFVISSISLTGIKNNIASLEAQVKTQAQSEQRMVLLKDRIAKITSAKKVPNSVPNLASVPPLLAGLSPGTTITQLQINATNVELAVNITSNTDLSAFLSTVKGSTFFKTVNLTAFSLGPTTGYSVEIAGVKK